jgi:hypothetical protein
LTTLLLLVVLVAETVTTQVSTVAVAVQVA